MESDNIVAVAASSALLPYRRMIAEHRLPDAQASLENQSQPGRRPIKDGSWRSYYEDPECEEG